MLKTIVPLEKLTFEWLKVGDDEINRFCVSDSVKYTKKSGKLFKSRKSKSEKMSKSQNLAKSGKKLSKSENLTNFNATKTKPKFLIFNTRIAFNYLQLTFIEALMI